MKTDLFKFAMIRAAFFPEGDGGDYGVEMSDITSTGLPFVFTAEEAIELGHKLVEAGAAALTSKRKAAR
jgi:hypothetical protein